MEQYNWNSGELRYLEDKRHLTSISIRCSIVLFRPSDHYCFSLLARSVIEREVLKFLTISMNMFISLCSSFSFCFKKLHAVSRYVNPYNKQHS